MNKEPADEGFLILSLSEREFMILMEPGQMLRRYCDSDPEVTEHFTSIFEPDVKPEHGDAPSKSIGTTDSGAQTKAKASDEDSDERRGWLMIMECSAVCRFRGMQPCHPVEEQFMLLVVDFCLNDPLVMSA